MYLINWPLSVTAHLFLYPLRVLDSICTTSFPTNLCINTEALTLSVPAKHCHLELEIIYLFVTLNGTVGYHELKFKKWYQSIFDISAKTFMPQ